MAFFPAEHIDFVVSSWTQFSSSEAQQMRVKSSSLVVASAIGVARAGYRNELAAAGDQLSPFRDVRQNGRSRRNRPVLL